jgi:protein phosphatase methylesterase 1
MNRLPCAALCALALSLPLESLADAPAAMPEVRDDPVLQRAVELARSEFLAGQPFDRFHVTVLVEHADGTWLRGAVEGDALAYPASCVKLPFMVAAVHWCAEQGRAPDCLDEAVRPMVVESDNVATGVVVDAVSGVANVEGPDEAYADWLERRRYTERLFASAGLLAGQRLFTKTYPTNSGEEPNGFEARAWRELGSNRMSADGAARIMLALVSGALEPQGREYMRSLLRRPRFSGHSSLGTGLPPGSLHENKVGTAFDTLEDVMHAELPNGRRLVIAAFSNGWDAREPEPWDVARLGRFTELLLRRLDLARGLPAPAYLEPSRDAQDGVFDWPLDPPADGRYELAVWYESSPGQTASAQWQVDHAGGTERVVRDQQVWGARWIKLGDFDLQRGQGRVTLTSLDDRPVAPGVLRLARWPD